MQEWTAGADLPAELVSFLVARFPHLLLHSLRPDPFDNGVAAAFSRGDVKAILRIESSDSSMSYRRTRAYSGKFAGLSFGPVNLNNDRVFQLRGNPSSVLSTDLCCRPPVYGFAQARQMHGLVPGQ